MKCNCQFLAGSQTRYQVKDFPDGGALLRIDPVKAGRDDATYECVAENGVGDAVSAEATLQVFEGKCILSEPDYGQGRYARIEKKKHENSIMRCATLKRSKRKMMSIKLKTLGKNMNSLILLGNIKVRSSLVK